MGSAGCVAPARRRGGPGAGEHELLSAVSAAPGVRGIGSRLAGHLPPAAAFVRWVPPPRHAWGLAPAPLPSMGRGDMGRQSHPTVSDVRDCHGEKDACAGTLAPELWSKRWAVDARCRAV